MPPSTPRIVGLIVLLLPFAVAACGESPPPPRHSTSRAALAARGEAAPTGTTARSLGDSALEPAAEEAFKAEDWQRAETLYRELVRRQPNNPAGPYGLGRALMHLDRNDEAAAVMTEGLKLKDDGRTRIDLGAAYAAAGRYPSALPHLRKAVQLAPRDPEAWARLAETLVRVDKPDGAAETLRESKRPCPACAGDQGWERAADEVARALAARAEKQADAGDAAGARKSLDAATALRPDLADAHLVAAKLARAKGDGKAAADAYRKAIPGLTGGTDGERASAARLDLAALLVERGEAVEAVTLARQVVSANGTHAAGWMTLGRACDATRDRDCAKKAYGEVLRLPATPAVPKEAREHAQRRVKELKGRRR